MKDQYFGDINDYLKYGILRCLAEAGWKLGVVWMLTPDDGRSDGNKIKYLEPSTGWRRHDPALFDKLDQVVRVQKSRQVAHAEEDGLLPAARFYGEPVPQEQGARFRWYKEGLKRLSGATLLFFDPDNGLQVESVRPGYERFGKYLAWEEVERAWPHASLLIFQHYPRYLKEGRTTYVHQMADALGARTPGGIVIPLVTGNVLFLLACRSEHVALAEKATSTIRARWQGKIDILDPVVGGMGVAPNPPEQGSLFDL